jgi:hypothetical protein
LLLLDEGKIVDTDRRTKHMTLATIVADGEEISRKVDLKHLLKDSLCAPRLRQPVMHANNSQQGSPPSVYVDFLRLLLSSGEEVLIIPKERML